MSLDFSPLSQAIAQLEKSLGYANSQAALADPGLCEQMRNSVILYFKPKNRSYPVAVTAIGW